MDQKKLEQAARLIIEAVGEDPEREGLLETPRRFAEMVAEQLAYAAVPNEEIARAFQAAGPPTCTGLIPETFQRRPGVLRSGNPTHSVTGHVPSSFCICSGAAR